MEKVFKWFTQETKVAKAQVSWFASRFRPEEFSGVDQMLSLFIEYCSFLSVFAKRSYLTAFLNTEGKEKIKSNGIRLSTMDSFDYKDPASLEEACRVIFSATLAAFDEYAGQDVVESTFKVDVFEFIKTKKLERIQNAMMTSFPALSNGEDPTKVSMDLQVALSTIDSVYDVNAIEALDFLTGDKAEETEKDGIMRKIFDMGIPCIDHATGGISSKQLISLVAQPGAGKTRFWLSHVVYPAAVIFKKGVLFDELELTKTEVKNILIAHHITNLYDGKVKIPDNLINSDRLTTEQRQYVESARVDLFESNGKYGRILIRDSSLYVEEMEKNTLNFLRHNADVEVWCIDYMGILKSRPRDRFDRPLLDFQIIQEGCKAAKGVAKTADIAVCALHQYNNEGIQAAYAGKKITPSHIQGGQFVAHHSDLLIAMAMTEEQEIANIRTLSSVKKRAATGFNNVPLLTDLAVSNFRQQRVDSTS